MHREEIPHRHVAGLELHRHQLRRIEAEIAELFGRQLICACKPLTGFQVTRHKLADMASRLAAARALVGEAVVRVLRPGGQVEAAGLAAMAKNVATDMCSFVCDQAVQLHGGYGYMRETLADWLYRDARLYPIGGGTREIPVEADRQDRGATE